mgnify:CR=1 FL=1
MAFEKIYIGKGRRTNYGVRVTLKVDDVKLHQYNYKGIDYITFDVNEMRESDRYGNTHTVIVSKKIEDKPELPEPDPIEPDNDSLPF